MNKREVSGLNIVLILLEDKKKKMGKYTDVS